MPGIQNTGLRNPSRKLCYMIARFPPDNLAEAENNMITEY